MHLNQMFLPSKILGKPFRTLRTLEPLHQIMNSVHVILIFLLGRVNFLANLARIATANMHTFNMHFQSIFSHKTSSTVFAHVVPKMRIHMPFYRPKCFKAEATQLALKDIVNRQFERNYSIRELQVHFLSVSFDEMLF